MTSTEHTPTEHNNENGTNQQYEPYNEADAQASTEDKKQNHQNDTVIEIKQELTGKWRKSGNQQY